jgi:TRAP-type C4-dicarboxylate transport system permease small subunit
MSIGLKITRQIRVFLMAISSTFIAMATALATLNALARRLALGVAWSEELTSYFVVLLVFLAIPYLEGKGDQLCITAIDLVVKGETGQRILNYIRGLATSAACVMLTYYGFSVTLTAFERSQVTYVLHMPKGILYGIATLTLALTVIVWLVIMICNKGEFDE